MKQIISGRLAADPKLQEVTLADGTNEKVVNFTLFVYDPAAPEETREDGSTYKIGIPISCAAWGQAAEEVAGLKKGSLLTASSTMRLNRYKSKDGKDVREPRYVIKRIDPNNEIQKQMSQLLSEYEEGKGPIYREGVQPDFSDPKKENRKEQSMEPEQEKEAGRSEEERFQKDYMQQRENGSVNVEEEQKTDREV